MNIAIIFVIQSTSWEKNHHVSLIYQDFFLVSQSYIKRSQLRGNLSSLLDLQSKGKSSCFWNLLIFGFPISQSRIARQLSIDK